MQAASTPFTPLYDLSPDANGHFQLAFWGVLVRMLAHLEALSRGDGRTDLMERFPFLASYRDLLRAHQPDLMPPQEQIAWWQAQADEWQAQVDGHLPLRALAQMLNLHETALQLVMLAGLVEEDIRFGAVFATLQHPLAARRPCLGLLGWLLSDPGSPALDVWPVAQELIHDGLLLVDNDTEPRAEWLLRVPPPSGTLCAVGWSSSLPPESATPLPVRFRISPI